MLIDHDNVSSQKIIVDFMRDTEDMAVVIVYSILLMTLIVRYTEPVYTPEMHTVGSLSGTRQTGAG